GVHGLRSAEAHPPHRFRSARGPRAPADCGAPSQDVRMSMRSPVRMSSRRSSVLVPFLPCVAALLSPTLAFAQGAGDKAAAVALFDEAEKLMAQSQFAAACPKYAESYRLEPAIGALVHLADCQEKAGQLATAWASWRDAAELADTRKDSRGDYARQRIA